MDEVKNKKDNNVVFIPKRLQEALGPCLNYPVTIVEAPMGYGKTMAIRTYLRHKEVKVVWVTFSAQLEQDIWTTICQAMEKQQPDLTAVVRRISKVGAPESEECLHEILKVMKSVETLYPIVFVLDDYHLVEQSLMNRLIEMAASIGIANIHVIVLTRDSYQGNAHMLELKRRIHFIRKDSFILSPADIKDYYQLHGVPLGDHDAVLLFHNTEGWISALYLQLQRYLKDGMIVQLQSVFDLIQQEVYCFFTDELKEFLHAVCMFEVFCFEQADFVWKKDNTRSLIQELSSQNSFLTYDDGSQVFKLQGVLRSYLKQLLEQLPKEKSVQIYRQCGAWFQNEKNYLAAIEMYLKADDYEHLMESVEADGGRNSSLARKGYLEQIINQCPSEIRIKHPYAVLIATVYAYLLNQKRQYYEYCHFLKEAVDAVTDGNREKRKREGFLAVASSFGEYNDVVKMSKYHRKAWECFGEEAQVLNLFKSTWTTGTLSMVMLFYREAGMLQEQLKQVKDLLPHYFKLTTGDGMGSTFLMEAECSYHAGDFTQAKILTYAASASATRNKQIGNLCSAIFLRIRIAGARGEYSTVKDCLSEIYKLSEQGDSEDNIIVTMRELIEGYLYAFLGKPEFIPIWLKGNEGPSKRLYVFSYPSYYIIKGRLLLLEQKYEQLIGMMTALLREKTFNRHVLFYIYGTIYMAAALLQLGKRGQGIKSLSEVLTVAISDKIYLPFVENYSFLSVLLKELSENPKYSEAVKHILELASVWEVNVENIIGDSTKKIRDELTKRETEIAKLAYQGRSNQEIANQLYIASSTVKRALVGIFRKLDINSRHQLKEYKKYFE